MSAIADHVCDEVGLDNRAEIVQYIKILTGSAQNMLNKRHDISSVLSKSLYL